MKLVRVKNHSVDVNVLVDWNNKLKKDVKELSLKKGDDLGIFYRNNPKSYTYENIPLYTKPYTPNEILDHLRGKNPKIDSLISKFDMILSA